MGITVIALLAAMVALWERYRACRVMERIGRMLDLAMEERFSETVFDESRLSRLESKFARFLLTATVSARQIGQERDKINTIISDISHQTKTPIANLLLYSELLQEETLTESAADYVQSIHGQTEKLRFLIDALIKISRLENGILVLAPKEQALSPMLEKIAEQYQKRAQEKGLSLMVEETSLTAFLDAKWTGEAVGNIVDNAIKYTREGKIEITAVAYDMFVKIDVADTGIGIAEEEQAQIFTRFYRSGSVADKEGVGIGLYLARAVVSAQGGYIRVVSKPGAGSVFSVFLPREAV